MIPVLLTLILVIGLLPACNDNDNESSWNEGSWSEMIAYTTNELMGVWGSSPSDVFAVGNGVIRHYDGNDWSEMAVPPFELNDVWGTSSSDVFAVGSRVILHYDGTAWNEMSIDPKAQSMTLRAIWGSSPTDVFAVGIFGTILHYDGTAWSHMTSGTLVSLTSIWGSSPSDVFAVGLSNSPVKGIVLHYDGTAWSSQNVDTYADTSYLLRDIWGTSSSNVFATGIFFKPYVSETSPSEETGVIMHFDGNSWSPTTIDPAYFYAIRGNSPTDIFAVGAKDVEGQTNRGIWHSDGKSWSEMEIDIVKTLDDSTKLLRDIWCSSSDVFAVGEHGSILQ